MREKCAAVRTSEKTEDINKTAFKSTETDACTQISEEVGKTEKELPRAIADLLTKHVITGGLIAAAFAGFAFILGEHRVLLLSVFGLWIMFTGFQSAADYRKGKITERYAVCTGIQISRFRDETSVAFETAGNAPKEHLQFVISGRKQADDFILNGYYYIYFRANAGNTLVAYSRV